MPTVTKLLNAGTGSLAGNTNAVPFSILAGIGAVLLTALGVIALRARN